MATFLLVALLLAAVGVVIFQGIAVALAVAVPRLDPLPPTSADDPTAPAGRVSVIVAARNEEADLPGCLDSLLRQDYSDLEIWVVDGHSTDATRAIALARAPRIRLLDEPPLPEGWVGKSWACDVGARAATGDYLLFTDADVRYHPAAVRTTLAWAQRERADLATLAPRLETISLWERVVLPFMAQMVLTYFRTPRVNRATSRAAMANGQYTLVRREAYRKVGGHAAVRGAVLEDVRLAQEFRKAALRLRISFAPELIVTRMYRDRREMFEGLLKNIHGTRFSSARQLAFLAALVGLYWLPLGLLPLGALWGSWPLVAAGGILYLALFAKHAEFARAMGGRRRDGLLYPVAVGFYVALVLTSLRRGLARRPIEWKGRKYPLNG